jgi:hypothetical protein
MQAAAIHAVQFGIESDNAAALRDIASAYGLSSSDANRLPDVVSGLVLLRRRETAPTIVDYRRPAAQPFLYTNSGGADLDSIGIAAGAAGGGGSTDPLVVWLTFVRSLPRTCGEGRVLLRGALYGKFREYYVGMDERGLQVLKNMIPFCGFTVDEVTIFNAFIKRRCEELNNSLHVILDVFFGITAIASVATAPVVGGGIGAFLGGIGGVSLIATICLIAYGIHTKRSTASEINRLEEEYAARHGLVLADTANA